MNQSVTNNPASVKKRTTHIQAGTTSRKYQAFLLRIWREESGTAWRVQIEDPYTNEIVGFKSLAMLKQFLDEQFPIKGGDGAII